MSSSPSIPPPTEPRLDRLEAKLGKKVAFRRPNPKKHAEIQEQATSSLNNNTKGESSSSRPRRPRSRRGSGKQTQSSPQQARGNNNTNNNNQQKSSVTPKKTWRELAAPKEEPKEILEVKCERGENVPEGFEFVAWRVVRTYPAHYVGKANGPRVKACFDKIYELQRWDFFYLFDPQSPHFTPRLLVPTSQVQALLDLVNHRLDISLRIPRGSEAAKFHLTFGQGGTPRPRYLRFTNKESLDFHPPGFTLDDMSAFEAASPQHQDDWRADWKLMVVKDDPEKKQLAREKAERKKKAREEMMGDVRKMLGLAEYAVDERAVFICVDVEALERYHRPVSEIGLAVLDLRDIMEVEPGEGARKWWEKMKCYHIRTSEYAGLRNYQFVQGCPDAFDFGTSTFAPKAQLADAVLGVIGHLVNTDRQLFLVGHDVGGDIRYLSSVGCHVMAWKNLAGKLDSQVLHQVWKESTMGRGLKTVLADLGISYRHLHNAGNDAAFTLRAVLGLAVEHAGEEEKKDEREGGKMAAALEHEDEAKDEQEGGEAIAALVQEMQI